MSAPRPDRPTRAVLVLYGAALILAGAVTLPLWKPLLLAAALAAPMASLHDRAARALGNRRTLSAALFTAATILVIVLPIAAAGLFVVDQAIDLVNVVRTTLKHSGVSGLLGPLPDSIEGWLRYLQGRLETRPREVVSQLHLPSRFGWALGVLAAALGAVSNVLFAFVMMAVALFFLLRDGHALAAWFKQKSPLAPDTVDRLVGELSDVSKSVIAGNVATGAVQSVVATVGYLIAGVPSALLLGLLTFLASFIPSVGTAIIGLPIVGLLVLLGRGWWALFLAGWMAVVVGLVDNFLRPLLMRGRSKLRGSLVFFSLMGGVLMFGAMGLVVGPLALGFFLAMSSAVRQPSA